MSINGKNLSIAIGLSVGFLVYAILFYLHQKKKLKTLVIFVSCLVYWAAMEWALEIILIVVLGFLTGYLMQRYVNRMMYIPIYTLLEFIILDIKILVCQERSFYCFKIFMGEQCESFYYRINNDGTVFVFAVVEQAEYYSLSVDSIIFWLNPIVILGFIVYCLILCYAVPPLSILICDVHLRILSVIGLCFWDGILPEAFNLLVVTIISGHLFCLTIVTYQLIMPFVKWLIDNSYEILLFFIASISIAISVEILFLAPKDVRLFVMISVLFVVLIVVLKETFFYKGK